MSQCPCVRASMNISDVAKEIGLVDGLELYLYKTGLKRFTVRIVEENCSLDGDVYYQHCTTSEDCTRLIFTRDISSGHMERLTLERREKNTFNAKVHTNTTPWEFESSWGLLYYELLDARLPTTGSVESGS